MGETIMAEQLESRNILPLTEQWEHWIPRENLARRYHVKSVIEDEEGLTILLVEDKREDRGLKVSFGYAADAYRSTYETLRHMLVMQLDEKYGTEFYSKWTFFRVINSPYKKWLTEQAAGIIDDTEYKHFAFLTPDLILDVLSQDDPVISDMTFM